MATNEPFWLGVPKSNMWPSRDSFQFEDAASQSRKSATAFADVRARATSQQPGWGAGAGSGKQLGEKQLPSETGRKNRQHLLWMLNTLGKGKTLQKEQSVRDDNGVRNHSTGEQSAGSVMRSRGCLEVLAFNFNFNRHSWSHNSKLH